MVQIVLLMIGHLAALFDIVPFIGQFVSQGFNRSDEFVALPNHIGRKAATGVVDERHVRLAGVQGQAINDEMQRKLRQPFQFV